MNYPYSGMLCLMLVGVKGFEKKNRADLIRGNRYWAGIGEDSPKPVLNSHDQSISIFLGNFESS